MPLIDRSVKSGTGNEREKRWGTDRRKDIGPDSNPCPPWASSPNVVGATVCATVSPSLAVQSASVRALQWARHLQAPDGESPD